MTKLRIVNGGDDGAGEPPPIGVKAHAGLWDLSHAEFNNRVRVGKNSLVLISIHSKIN